MSDEMKGLRSCPFCKKPPGTKVGPPAFAKCITPGCEGLLLGAKTLSEWNDRDDSDPALATSSARIAELEADNARMREARGPYLIWSNEHRCWWRANSQGYTLHVDAAGRYSKDEAMAIARSSRNGWIKGKAPDEIAVAERDVLDCANLSRAALNPEGKSGEVES